METFTLGSVSGLGCNSPCRLDRGSGAARFTGTALDCYDSTALLTLRVTYDLSDHPIRGTRRVSEAFAQSGHCWCSMTMLTASDQ